MFKIFIEHYKNRKIAVVVTVFMAAIFAIPTYYLLTWAYTLGRILYTIIFILHMLGFFLCWHYVKDESVYYWRRRQKK